MTLINLLIISLAANQLTELWHHGDLFAVAREKVRHTKIKTDSWWVDKLTKHLLCPYCVTFSTTAACVIAAYCHTAAYHVLLMIAWQIVMILGTWRLANLIADAAKWLRK